MSSFCTGRYGDHDHLLAAWLARFGLHWMPRVAARPRWEGSDPAHGQPPCPRTRDERPREKELGEEPLMRRRTWRSCLTRKPATQHKHDGRQMSN
jgi:hypothetical protein